MVYIGFCYNCVIPYVSIRNLNIQHLYQSNINFKTIP